MWMSSKKKLLMSDVPDMIRTRSDWKNIIKWNKNLSIIFLISSAEMKIDFTMELMNDTGKNIRRDWRSSTISKKSSSLHVVIRQSIWEEVRFYQEVRSDKQLVSHDIKLKDVSAVKDFFRSIRRQFSPRYRKRASRSSRVCFVDVTW